MWGQGRTGFLEGKKADMDGSEAEGGAGGALQGEGFQQGTQAPMVGASI